MSPRFFNSHSNKINSCMQKLNNCIKNLENEKFFLESIREAFDNLNNLTRKPPEHWLFSLEAIDVSYTHLDEQIIKFWKSTRHNQNRAELKALSFSMASFFTGSVCMMILASTIGLWSIVVLWAITAIGFLISPMIFRSPEKELYHAHKELEKELDNVIYYLENLKIETNEKPMRRMTL